LAAPFAVIVGGVHKIRGGQGGGLPSGMRVWVVLTTVVIVGMGLGLTGNAGSGMGVFGVDFDALLVVVPYAWLATAILWLGFFLAARRRVGADKPAPESSDPP
jgi:hypothetical protein